MLTQVHTQLDDPRDVLHFASASRLHREVLKLRSQHIAVRYDDSRQELTSSDVSDIYPWIRPLTNLSVPEPEPKCCHECVYTIELFWNVNCFLGTQQVRKITFSGSPMWRDAYLSNMEHEGPRHATGLRNLKKQRQLESFEFRMDWRCWRTTILAMVLPAHLRILDIPVRCGADCGIIREFLSRAPCLEDLSLRGIPNEVDDVRRTLASLHHLGYGIFGCRKTLRYLRLDLNKLEIGNWVADPEAKAEMAIRPFGFHLRRIFPIMGPPEDEYRNKGARYFDQHEDLKLLDLKLLELHGFSIPRAAFRNVFNPKTLKNLHLGESQVENSAWEGLRMHASLESLTDVEYDMVTKEFGGFLESQTGSLTALSFKHPKDLYEPTDTFSIPETGEMVTAPRLIRRARTLGPANASERAHLKDARHDYLSTAELSTIIRRMAKLESLEIPGTMMDVTPAVFRDLSHCQNLRRLELSFHYGSWVSQCSPCSTRTPTKLEPGVGKGLPPPSRPSPQSKPHHPHIPQTSRHPLQIPRPLLPPCHRIRAI